MTLSVATEAMLRMKEAASATRNETPIPHDNMRIPSIAIDLSAAIPCVSFKITLRVIDPRRLATPIEPMAWMRVTAVLEGCDLVVTHRRVTSLEKSAPEKSATVA
ncbi:MAG TPA: hypothetical protein VF920_13225 [Dongiaceae bacterium]